MLRSILHCDMNNFYASVECMLDPALKKYPIAVCGSVEERHGIVLAKNYKAKAFDVKTGDAVWQAKQKCKDLVVVPPHYEEYIKYSKLARSVYERYTDQVEPYGMDECWLDISGTESLFGSPEKVANEIRETTRSIFSPGSFASSSTLLWDTLYLPARILAAISGFFCSITSIAFAYVAYFSTDPLEIWFSSPIRCAVRLFELRSCRSASVEC